jgi:hypothetical protein
VGTQSDICDQRYRTEPGIGTSDIGLKSAEYDIISDIGINFCPISNSDINIHKSSQRSGKWLDSCHESRGYETREEHEVINYFTKVIKKLFISFRYRNIRYCLVQYLNGS